MKVTIHIEAYTISAYRAIRPALVTSKVGCLGVSGMTFSAIINQSDYAYLVDVINHAAQDVGIPRDEYSIIQMQTISLPKSLR